MNRTDIHDLLTKFYEETVERNKGQFQTLEYENNAQKRSYAQMRTMQSWLVQEIPGLIRAPVHTTDPEITGGNRGFIRTPKQVFLLKYMAAFSIALTHDQISSLISSMPIEVAHIGGLPDGAPFPVWVNSQFSGELLRRLKRAERWGLVLRFTDGKKYYFAITAEGRRWARNSSL